MSDRAVEAATAESEAVATLHALNAEYIRAFLESDVAWYAEHLSDDFVCTLADGRRIGKPEFLERTKPNPGVTNLAYEEIDVRPLGEVVIVHGVTHYRRGGEPGSTRYTDVWHSRDGRWLAVAAHLTRVTA
jgi:ketosteroid isomerase-like protein